LDQIRGILRAGRDAILTIDPQGARAVRGKVPDALLLFVMPPSMDVLDARLSQRGSEDAASQALRRHNAVDEIAAANDYDHIVVNETGHVEEAAERIWEVIQAEARREPPRRVRL
jgi:guanylate kinase